MKLLIPIFILLCGTLAHGQSVQHTIRRADGTTVRYSTVCYGVYSLRCTTTVTEGGSRPYSTPDIAKAFCADMQFRYGWNMQQYSEPMSDLEAGCISDKKLKKQIWLSNRQKRQAGQDARTMNPLYAPPPPPMKK